MVRARATTTTIRDVAYHSSAKPDLGFEIFTLRSLYARRPADELGVPQRLDFDIVYLGTHGKGTVGIDFAPVPVGKGVATFVARGRIQIRKQVPDVDAWMLLMRPDFLAPDPRAIDPLRAPRFLSPDSATPFLRIAGALEREVLGLCDQLAAEYARPLDRFQPAICEALLRAVLLRLEREHPDTPPPSPALARFRAALERDFATTRSVERYARATGVSPRVLHQVCVPAGASPKALIDRRVALEAQRLLAHTDLAVKELAARLGFSEATNFVRFFAAHADGATPQEFRKRLFARRS